MASKLSDRVARIEGDKGKSVARGPYRWMQTPLDEIPIEHRREALEVFMPLSPEGEAWCRGEVELRPLPDTSGMSETEAARALVDWMGWLFR